MLTRRSIAIPLITYATRFKGRFQCFHSPIRARVGTRLVRIINPRPNSADGARFMRVFTDESRTLCLSFYVARSALNRVRLSIADYSLFGCPMTTFNKPSVGTSSKLRISRLSAWSNGLWNRTYPGNKTATIGTITAKAMQMNPSSLRTVWVMASGFAVSLRPLCR